MREGSQTDLALLKMPSFKAMRSFVAAARYRSFTRAADALCVTQAAISRQIRDLELHLGTDLFVRSGRDLRLTPAGTLLFDSAQLSLLNIFHTTERIRRQTSDKDTLTLCCTHAFSSMFLAHRLTDFLASNNDVGLNVITTERFQDIEPGIEPDVFVTQALDERPGYLRVPLFHVVVYPVCSPAYLEAQPQLPTLQGMRDSALLDLDPYGRSQLTEQFDWNAWFAWFAQDLAGAATPRPAAFSSNDYNLLIQMALNGHGIALGWDHLVKPLIAQGRLVRPVSEQVVLRDEVHYLVINENKAQVPACQRLTEWLLEQFK
ncbi:LysR substrate-binding domain-containing protein [Pseudomonas sp. 21LCFQ010]|uniref:LysR substrate-binding domain-containing protein n=1 Tax=Pseudomonas sp. 21LCFQ010 TaxID=2957506 RepID=UPI00209840EC|nr:LysR substrate-binding domain-containing protein [Pseudomonas sp. 21LCFQ010]MCO8161237.1 LysR substrate-binding domain-containing protein [Pseudomonas sp. 21LCFQ010]